MRHTAGRIHRLRPAIVALAVLAGGTIVSPGLAAQSSSVSFSTVGTQVRPSLELRVPSGEVRQDTDIPVGDARFNVSSAFDIYTGSINGRLRLYRSWGRLTPELAVGLALDTEPPLSSELAGRVDFVSLSEAVERTRDYSLGARWKLPLGTLSGGVSVEERLFFSGSQEAAESQDLLSRLSWDVDDVRPVLPEATPETVGGYLRLGLEQRTSLDAATAVALRLRVNGSLNYRLGERWRIEHRLQAGSPVYAWSPGRVRLSSIGGFDTVRGLDGGEVSSWRELILGTTAARGLGARGDAPDAEVRRIRFHSMRALSLMDAAVYQRDQDLIERPRVTAGTGLGLASTITAPNGFHIDTRAFLAVPLDRTPMPVVYLRSSLFVFSGGD